MPKATSLRLLRQTKLMALTRDAAPDTIRDDVEALLTAGVRVIQLRAKALQARDLETLAHDLNARCTSAGACLIINDSIELMKAVQAAGVHLGESDHGFSAPRQYVSETVLVGLTCRNAGDVLSATAGGADYVGLGPVFATATKVIEQAPGGLALLRDAGLASGEALIVGIGGITRENARSVIEAGADAVAICAGLYEGASVEANARELLAILQAR